MSKKRNNDFPDNGFEQWGGYMNAKVTKLEEQYAEKALKEENKTSSIFEGISIFVNGYTKPSADQLKCLMSEHGGVFHHYFRTNRTKFIIASNLPDTKVKNLPSTKIVKPEWITDSIKAGTLLDYKNYLLYSNYSKTQPRLDFKVDNTSFIGTFNQENNDNLKEHNQKTDSESTGHGKQNISDDIKSAQSAVNPKFLEEFYNNSRLHHISQLGATFKQYINELRNQSDSNFPLRKLLKENAGACNERTTGECKGAVIMHIDMDSFFVSVGLRNNPDLRGKPVAVTHAKNTSYHGKRSDEKANNRQLEFEIYKKRLKDKMSKTGETTNVDVDFDSRMDEIINLSDKSVSMSEIASCSYEARALGIHNGMFMGAALQLCPNLKTIPYDFEGYKEVAYALYDTVAQYTLDIEPVSCDEMYVDCTELLNDTKLSAMEFANVLRTEIKNKTGCPCSTGFGKNRLQARLATKKAKPDGQFNLIDYNIEAYFSDIPLRDLPGVGRQMQYKLNALGFMTCGSLRLAKIDNLKKHFGNKTGELLYNYCRGKDEKALNLHAVRKSISAGVNYGIRFERYDQCTDFLKQLCNEVHSRMMSINVVGKSITYKLMVRAENAPIETAKFMGHGVCDVITKSVNLSEPTDDLELITKEILKINEKMNIKPEEMRGINIQINKLETKNIKSILKHSGIQKFLNPGKLNENCQAIRNMRETLHQCSVSKIINRSTLNEENLCVNKLDKDVLNALPDEIRAEVLEYYSINKEISLKNNINVHNENRKINDDSADVIDNNENLNLDHQETPTNKFLDFDILKLSLREVCDMLKMWIESSSKPLSCDIKLIEMYIQHLITTREIENAKYLLTFTYRTISKMGCCKWHQVYLQMVQCLQENMILVYGKRMALFQKFECCY